MKGSLCKANFSAESMALGGLPSGDRQAGWRSSKVESVMLRSQQRKAFWVLLKQKQRETKARRAEYSSLFESLSPFPEVKPAETLESIRLLLCFILYT